MKSVSLGNQGEVQNIDIAIVGAGPQALTLVAHILQKKAKLRHRMLVLDPSGTWLSQWRHQFAAQGISHLRSPAVHHPHPNPYQLRKFAEHRPQELFPPYDLPGTNLFNDFCDNFIKNWQLKDLIFPDKVTHILPIKYRFGRRFQLFLESGNKLIARRVILATGGGIPQLPNWVSDIQTPYPQDRLLHSQKIDLRALNLKDKRILIVGGGLTSGHLAVGAIEGGGRVILMARRALKERLFDTDPGWLGPKYLKKFHLEVDWEKRWKMIHNARDGGSMTPAMLLKLRRITRNKPLVIEENCEVIEAQWQVHKWQIKCHNKNFYCDQIWLATGTKFGVNEHPLLTDVQKNYPIQLIHGLPILDKYLRWPSLELFIMGGLSALQVGPIARNLAGGIKGSRSISKALAKPSLATS